VNAPASSRYHMVANMGRIEIALPPAEVHIKADRRLAFEVLTAWGSAGPDGKPTSRMIEEQEGRKLIEFRTSVKGIFGRKTVYVTQEWVTTQEPERISFRGHKGPVPVLRDELVLVAEGPCCRLRYESTFALGWGYLGWLLGKLYVTPMMRRFMREHLSEVKRTIEARASRSRVYPQQPCSHEMSV
ncbi:MAG: SRPBCC family protein, partial [Chloroflexi bacterium]|nr:SRPBCC family protein [Chloroflexota bacterium]